MLSGLLKSAIGAPWSITLCYGSSCYILVYSTIPSYIVFFSIRKTAEKVEVVIITRFPPKVLVIKAITGSLILLLAKAKLSLFRIINGLKSRFWSFGWTRIKRLYIFEAILVVLLVWCCFFFSTSVYSSGFGLIGVLFGSIEAIWAMVRFLGAV
jgi:hypothetical protein